MKPQIERDVKFESLFVLKMGEFITCLYIDGN